MNYYVAFRKNELGNIYSYACHKKIFIFNYVRNEIY